MEKECDVRFLRSVTKLRGKKSDSRTELTFAVRSLHSLTGTRLHTVKVSVLESVHVDTNLNDSLWKKSQTQCEFCFHSLW